MSDLSPAQIQQLATALEDPTVSKQFRALLGLKSQETEEPASHVPINPSTTATTAVNTASGSNAGQKARPEKDLNEQDAQPRKEVEAASDILALVRDISLPRRVTFVHNTFVPNTTGLFYTLSLMDKMLAKTFKARRSHQMMNPYAHTLYFAILVAVQTARCMKYANVLDSEEDLSFLEIFLDNFPPEKLAIPGPLLPYFKALTTFKHQNEQYSRVTPAFPAESIDCSAPQYHVRECYAGPIFPNVPVSVALYNMFKTAVTAADSSAFHDAHWPFTLDTTNTDTPQHYTADVVVAGYSFAADRAWNILPAHNLNSPSSRFRPILPRDFFTNLKDNIDDWHSAPITTPTTQISSLRAYLSMNRMTWFKSFLAPMSIYSSMWIGSGSLADCSVDGPAPGAYINRYQQNPTAPTTPDKAFDSNAHFTLSTRMYTTHGTPEPINERIAAYSQIHSRLSTDHPMNNYLAAHRYRAGNVWDARPLYGPGSQDYTYETLEESLRRFVQPHLLK